MTGVTEMTGFYNSYNLYTHKCGCVGTCHLSYMTHIYIILLYKFKIFKRNIKIIIKKGNIKMNILEREAIKAKYFRKKEGEILDRIASVTSIEFARKTAEELDAKTHVYNFSTYIAMLEDVELLIMNQVLPADALKVVQSNMKAEEFLTLMHWKKIIKRLGGSFL